jgi:hypothetical protein
MARALLLQLLLLQLLLLLFLLLLLLLFPLLLHLLLLSLLVILVSPPPLPPPPPPPLVLVEGARHRQLCLATQFSASLLEAGSPQAHVVVKVAFLLHLLVPDVTSSTLLAPVTPVIPATSLKTVAFRLPLPLELFAALVSRRKSMTRRQVQRCWCTGGCHPATSRRQQAPNLHAVDLGHQGQSQRVGQRALG